MDTPSEPIKSSQQPKAIAWVIAILIILAGAAVVWYVVWGRGESDTTGNQNNMSLINANTNSESNSEDEWQTFSHSDWVITFQYPPGWTTEFYERDTIFLEPPSSMQSSPTITLKNYVKDSDISFDQYVRRRTVEPDVGEGIFQEPVSMTIHDIPVLRVFGEYTSQLVLNYFSMSLEEVLVVSGSYSSDEELQRVLMVADSVERISTQESSCDRYPSLNYCNEEYGIAFAYPVSWEHESYNDPSTGEYYPVVSESFQLFSTPILDPHPSLGEIQILFDVFLSDNDLDEWYANYPRVKVREDYDSYYQSLDVEDIQVDILNAKQEKIVTGATAPTDTEWIDGYKRNVIFQRADRMYLLTTIVHKQDEVLLDHFDDLIASIKLF